MSSHRYFNALALIAGVLLLGSSAAPAAAQQQTRLDATDHPAGSWVGWSVALDGDVVVTGSPLRTGGVGGAYVFERETGTVGAPWTQKGFLVPSDIQSQDQFGYAVDVEGDLIVASSGLKDTMGENAGAVYFFSRDNTGTWIESGVVYASDAEPGDLFGHSICLKGDRLIVSSIAENSRGNNTGAAYIFEKGQDGSWSEAARLQSDLVDGGDRFGVSVSIDGDTAVVGAHVYESFKGGAFVYERQGDGSWAETQVLQPADVGAPAWLFGYRVAIDGNRILASSIDDDDEFGQPARAGSAYVFERGLDGVWSEVTKLEADDKRPEEGFGQWVALEGDMAIIGTNVDDRSASPEGSAYLFRRSPTGAWTQAAKVLADDNTGYVDQFAWSVDISGDRAAIGSFLTGGDGTGAVYVLEDVRSTAIERSGDEVPVTTLLHQNYPNPFNPTTTISFDLPKTEPVSLTVSNLLGRQVRSLVSGVHAAGTYQVSFDASGLPTGVYLYRLEAGDFVETREMVLFR